ncbi:uncharacterized protein LOC115215707 [Argonauta hians]
MGTKVLDQILTMMLHGSPEEKHFIYNDSEIILECKLCRNLFRALTGFILHRKSLCMKPLEKSVSVNSYDQSMRTETFRNVTFITNNSSSLSNNEDSTTTTQQQQQQINTTSSNNNNNNSKNNNNIIINNSKNNNNIINNSKNNNNNSNNNNNNNRNNDDVDDDDDDGQRENLSAADHFQYLQNYVSQINESIESKTNLKAVLNLTQEGVAVGGSCCDVIKSADQTKVVDSPDRIIITDTSSPQVSPAISNVKNSSAKFSECLSHCSSSVPRHHNSHPSTLCCNAACDPVMDLSESRSSSPCTVTPHLKGPHNKVCCVNLDDDNRMNEESESSENRNPACIPPENHPSKRSTKCVAPPGNSTGSSSCCPPNKHSDATESPSEQTNSKSSRIEIIVNDNPERKDVIEINEVDCLEEKVSQSLSLDNLCCPPIDQGGPLDQCCGGGGGGNQKKEALQHYVCPHCPNTLIYDSYSLFCQHLESVHGIQTDPMDDSLGQAFDWNNQGSMSYLPERANQKYSECIVLELADYQNLQCRKCKHSFTQRCSLRRHILEIHGEKLGYYSCPFCVSKVWFRYFRTFLAHLKNLHGFQKDQIYRIHRNLQKNSWVEFGSDQMPPEGGNTCVSNRVS